MSVAVVYDAELLVAATSFAGSSWLEWPAVPPVTHNAEQDCLGVIASSVLYDRDFSLVVSHELLKQVEVALREAVGLRASDISDFLVAVLALTSRSGGVVVADPQSPATGAGPAVDVPLRLATSTRRLLAAHDDVCLTRPEPPVPARLDGRRSRVVPLHFLVARCPPA